MTDGREEPSASYKLGNGWVILHWCANLTIILTGFTFIPARINAQPDGQVFIVWAAVQVAVLVVLGMASQITVMRPLSMENWASPLRMCALFLAGVAWYFAAHAIVPALGGFWLVEIIPSAVLLLSLIHIFAMRCGLPIGVHGLLRDSLGSSLRIPLRFRARNRT